MSSKKKSESAAPKLVLTYEPETKKQPVTYQIVNPPPIEVRCTLTIADPPKEEPKKPTPRRKLPAFLREDRRSMSPVKTEVNGEERTIWIPKLTKAAKKRIMELKAQAKRPRRSK